MGNFDDLLKKHAKRLGIERQVEAVGVVEKATVEISRIVPREDFKVVSFKDGVLRVAVCSSVVASELNTQSRYVTQRITEVKRVVTVLASCTPDHQV